MFVEALIAVVVAIFVLAVFNGPPWAIRAGQFGGLGFMVFVLILLGEWVIEKINKK